MEMGDDRPQEGGGEDAARSVWRSPAGISAIAAVVGVAITVAALFLAMDDGAEPPPARAEEQTRLFVYGTSMPDHRNYPQIAEFVAEATPARVEGQLWDTGEGYPAAKFGAGLGTIDGFLLRLRPDRASEALRVMTQIESGLFERVTVETESGQTAWAYEWIGSTDGMEPVEGMWSGPEG